MPDQVTEHADRIVTAEAVARAADELLAEGQRPSNRKVMDKLGGGSHRDVGPLLAAWREAREEQDKLQAVEVPETLVKAAGDLVAGIWRDAMKAATAGHEGMRKQITTLNSRLEAQADEHGDELDGLTAETKRLEAERQAVLQDAAKAREERDQVQGKLDGAEVRISELERDIGTLQIRNESVVEKLADLRAERDRLLMDVKDARKETDTVRRELEGKIADTRKETETVRTAGEATAADLRAKAEQAQQEVTKLKVERDEANKRASTAEERAGAEATRATDALKEVARLTERLAAIQPRPDETVEEKANH